MGRRAVGRIQSVLWSRQDRLFLLDTGSPSLHNPSVLAGCQVYRYCQKATSHAPGLWSCFAGISHGTSFGSGVANAGQSPLTSLLSACLDQDLNMSYLVQPDTGAAVPRGSQHIPPVCRALCPPPDGETSCGAKNEGPFFLAKHGVLAHPTESPAMNPPLCSHRLNSAEGGTGLPKICCLQRDTQASPAQSVFHLIPLMDLRWWDESIRNFMSVG